MKTGKLALLAVSAGLAACSDNTTGPEEDARQVVVEAFLFAGEPVDDIRLTRTVPLGEDPALRPPSTTPS